MENGPIFKKLQNSLVFKKWFRIQISSNATPFPGFLHFTLDPYLIILSVKQGGIKNHFTVFNMSRPGIELRSLGPFVRTLFIRAMAQLIT